MTQITETPKTPVVDYQPAKRPLAERINFRMLTIVIIFSLLVGIPVYNFVKIQLNHGIENAGDHFKVDLKSLGNFPFNDTTGTMENIPAEFRKLDGKRVELEGFIYSPSGAGSKVNDFQFVYNVAKCCFGGPPLVQERVFASSPKGVEYLPDEVRIFGKLHISTEKDEVGKIEHLYTLDVERVEPL